MLRATSASGQLIKRETFNAAFASGAPLPRLPARDRSKWQSLHPRRETEPVSSRQMEYEGWGTDLPEILIVKK